MDEVIARAEDVRKLARALEHYEREVKEAGRKVEGALRSAYWRDRKKEQFELRFREFQKQAGRFTSVEVSDMVRKLNEFAHDIERMSKTRM